MYLYSILKSEVKGFFLMLFCFLYLKGPIYHILGGSVTYLMCGLLDN